MPSSADGARGGLVASIGLGEQSLPLPARRRSCRDVPGSGPCRRRRSSPRSRGGLEDLSGPRELDLELDPAGQVGGDLTRRRDTLRRCGPIGTGPITARLPSTAISRVPDVWPLAMSVYRPLKSVGMHGRTRRGPSGRGGRDRQRFIDGVELRSCPGPINSGPPSPSGRVADVAAESRRHDLAGIEVELESVEEHDVTARAFQDTRSPAVDRLEPIQADHGRPGRLVARRRSASAIPARPASWPGSPGRSSRSPGPLARRARLPASDSMVRTLRCDRACPCACRGISNRRGAHDPAEIVASMPPAASISGRAANASDRPSKRDARRRGNRVRVSEARKFLLIIAGIIPAGSRHATRSSSVRDCSHRRHLPLKFQHDGCRFRSIRRRIFLEEPTRPANTS